VEDQTGETRGGRTWFTIENKREEMRSGGARMRVVMIKREKMAERITKRREPASLTNMLFSVHL
jgi:hypothetical protein